MTQSYYTSSFAKRLFDLVGAFLGIIFVSPLFLAIALGVKVFTGTPIFFTQVRLGKNKVPFKIFKFRTMIPGSERRQKGLKKKNEADGPVFKIYNDPRFTKFGKVLARTGLDELPQLINVLRGEMSFVGPRPLPTSEAKMLPKKYRGRELITPGLTSLWVVNGSHKLSFKKWMELDLEYVKKGSLKTDLVIILRTFLIIFRSVFEKISTRS